MAEASDRTAAARTAAVLEIRGLNVYYGRSHALQGVDLTLGRGVLSVVGRNGMGKTTLCRTIMGLQAAAGGAIRFAGQSILGLSSTQIARRGIGYVPQGRRLWPSLTVEEHLRLTGDLRPGAWSVERIYQTFPRLAERRTSGGAQLSGGEQQMLAISRALLLNPTLLVMDEPTEGLAPLIVEQVEEILRHLGDEGDIAVLLIEQNIGVATSAAERVAIMVNGRIDRVMDAREIAGDRDLQQRLLGVGRHRDDDAPAPDAGPAEAEAPAATRAGPRKIYISNPRLPTRWTPPVPAQQIERAARTVSGLPAAAPAPGTPTALRPLASSGERIVVVAGTLDTKGREIRFIRDLIKAAGLRTRLVDLSTSGKTSSADVPPHQLAVHHPQGPSAVFTNDRGRSVAGMAVAFEAWIQRQSGIAGIIAAGGSGGSAMAAPAMRQLPAGVPKILISTVASGDVRRYVGPADIMMLHPIADVQGLNAITREVLANGAAAMVGMVKSRQEARRVRRRHERSAAGGRSHDVRRDHALRPAGDGGARRRLRLSGLPCDRHRRPGDGDTGRFGTTPWRHRPHHDRGLRSSDGRHLPGHPGPVRGDDPRAHGLCRRLRRARHGEFRGPRDGARALSRPDLLRAQSASDVDADDGRGESPDGPLDRRKAQPDGCAGPVLPARRRRLRARRAGPGVP